MAPASGGAGETGPVQALARFLEPARRLLVFTGAGISTASGIPDFRGPGGVWQRRQPVYYQDFLDSEAKRVEYWEYKVEGFEEYHRARPNGTHLAVARLEALGRLEAVVTQNIDGLHQAAGLDALRVVELHGTNRLVECVSCGAREAPDEAVARFRAEGRTPLCRCGGWLKFATISFGQALRLEVLQQAFQHARAADAVLALGSTLSVHPAASVPLAVRQLGRPYAIVNRGPTDHDALADLRIEAAVEEVLPRAVELLD